MVDNFDDNAPPPRNNSALWKKTRAGNLSFSSENLSNLSGEAGYIAQEARQKNTSYSNSQLTTAPDHPSDDNTYELDRLSSARGPLAAEVRREIDQVKMDYFFFGLTSGASLQMFFVAFSIMYISSGVDTGPLNELSKEYYPIFRMIFFIIWFFTLYGCVLFILKRFNVDYFTILDLTEHHTYNYVIRGAASLAYIVFTCFVLYVLTISDLLSSILTVEKHFWPFLAIALPCIIFFWPFDSMTHSCYGVHNNGYKQRINFMKQIGSILVSPFTQPTPLRCIMADVMCSMPKVFNDMLYTFYIYYTWDHDVDVQSVPQTEGYFLLCTYLAILPYSIRMLQVLRIVYDNPKSCSKNYFNFIKYSLSVSVTLLNVMQKNTTIDREDMLWWRKAWQCVALCTTCMSYYSDVAESWGLFQKNSKHLFLRDVLIFPQWSYYCAMILNFLFRICWAINISPGQPYVAQNFVLVIGCTELLRRNIWLIFKIENMSLIVPSNGSAINNNKNNPSCRILQHIDNGSKTSIMDGINTNYGSMEMSPMTTSTRCAIDKNQPYKVSFDDIQNMQPSVPTDKVYTTIPQNL
jgi:hypothetical protein